MTYFFFTTFKLDLTTYCAVLIDDIPLPPPPE